MGLSHGMVTWDGHMGLSYGMAHMGWSNGVGDIFNQSEVSIEQLPLFTIIAKNKE